MITLVVIACLGSFCKPYEVAESTTIMACITSSQPIAAMWANSHPGYRIKKISCELGKEV